jgi:hypothetical protein
MPRLRNRASGAVVNVDDATAARLGEGWESADSPTPVAATEVKRSPGRPKKTAN